MFVASDLFQRNQHIVFSVYNLLCWQLRMG